MTSDETFMPAQPRPARVDRWLVGTIAAIVGAVLIVVLVPTLILTSTSSEPPGPGAQFDAVREALHSRVTELENSMRSNLRAAAPSRWTRR